MKSYEIHLELPFGIEDSPECEADRLEIFKVKNPDVVTEIEYQEKPDKVVLCGNGKYSDK